MDIFRICGPNGIGILELYSFIKIKNKRKRKRKKEKSELGPSLSANFRNVLEHITNFC